MSFEKDTGMTTKRIEALADGIFAIAMTLLAFNLIATVPDFGSAIVPEKIIWENWHIFFNYFLSFILLSIFWITHHKQFHVINRTNEQHLWLNIIILMFVALIPFSTDLVGDHPDNFISNIIFEANLFILGALFFYNWEYSTCDKRLVDVDVRANLPKYENARALNILMPVISLIAMVIAVFTPRWSTWIYLLIPLLFMTNFFRKMRGKQYVDR